MKTPHLILFLVFATTAFAVTPTERPAAKPELPKQGVNLARASGGWLNVQVEDHRFIVNFYGADKKPIAPNATGGLVRFVYVTKTTSHRWFVPLTPANDGKPSLISPQRVKPPHVFRVYVTLSDEDPNTPGAESYAFQYP